MPVGSLEKKTASVSSAFLENLRVVRLLLLFGLLSQKLFSRPCSLQGFIRTKNP